MYKYATSRWLFNPEAVSDISRDVVHLAQMARRIGQDHDDAALKQCEIRERQHDLKGKETHFDIPVYLPSSSPGMLKCAGVGDAGLVPIESEFNELMLYNNCPKEVATFLRITRSFLRPGSRPRAAEALLDPAFKDILLD